MKIKIVCERTNLTDRTIRYYIEEGLISPMFTENYLGRKSFDFTEDNISELKDIAVLRSFDFSIEEIRQILNDPLSSLDIINIVKERVGRELITSQKKILVLSSLSERRAYTVCELARELSKPLESTYLEEKVKPQLRHKMKALLKGALFFVAVWMPLILSAAILISSLLSYENPIVHGGPLILTLLMLIPSLILIFASKIKLLQEHNFKTILLFLCIMCIPFSMVTTSKSIVECEHKFINLSDKIEATCSVEGEIVKQCEICEEIRMESVAAIGHSIVTDRKIASTCTETGMTEGSHCSVCGTVLVEQEIVPKTEHIYAKIVTEPTCEKDGYITLVCYCTQSYRERILFATEKHDFNKNGDKGYICSLCGLEVCEYGYVDGDNSGWNSNIRYYITGTVDSANEQDRTLVIFGDGDMQEPKYTANYPFRESVYVDEIKSVIICDGVTSIAEGAFEGAKENDIIFGNPFRSVTSFVVKGDLLTLDPHSKQMSGIGCEITYQRT